MTLAELSHNRPHVVLAVSDRTLLEYGREAGRTEERYIRMNNDRESQ